MIEIIVHGVEDIERLYESPYGVFLKRDGSVQTLGFTEVQEWSRQVFNELVLCIFKKFIIPA